MQNLSFTFEDYYKRAYLILKNGSLEEFAEVIQAISKIFRFGFDAQHPNEDRNNLQRLEEELGDLVCMIGLLMNKKIVSESGVESAAELKLKKLRAI